MSKKKTPEHFILEAKDVHANRYVYDDCVYISARNRVKIICTVHGPFYQWPSDHLNGSGCPKCGTLSSLTNRKISTQDFIDRAIDVHGNRYDYSKTNYIKAHEKAIITCHVHGEFYQTPNAHVTGHGCPACGNSSAREFLVYSNREFIKKSRAVHGNKYDYSLVQYINAYQKVKIVCLKHGMFEQIPSKHLQGHGCRACSRRNHSNKAIRWLNTLTKHADIFIQHAENGGEYRIPTTQYFVDGFCAQTNTVYEYYGDVYHGNPKIFLPEERCHPYDINITAGELYQKTLGREQKIVDLGYNLVVKWENNVRSRTRKRYKT